MVLAGHGRVAVTRDGKRLPSIQVDGSKLYTVLASNTTTDGVLEFQASPGVRLYSFTFG
jgi:hypothetical protein